MNKITLSCKITEKVRNLQKSERNLQKKNLQKEEKMVNNNKSYKRVNNDFRKERTWENKRHYRNREIFSLALCPLNSSCQKCPPLLCFLGPLGFDDY